MMSILLINPNTSAGSLEMMLAIARPLLPAGVMLGGVSADRGAPMILDEAALGMAAAEVLRIGTEARDIDAIVVAAFGDPGASRLRERLSIPVIGIGEAAIREAAQGGRRFGIVTTTPGLVRSIEAAVRVFGVDAGFRGVRVPEGDPLMLAANPHLQDAALALAAMQCIELDGAEAVVIGGGPLSQTAERLRKRLTTVIVEPIPAAIRRLLETVF